MSGQWVSDGSPEIKINGSELQCKLSEDSSGGNVYNGLWKEIEKGYTSGIHYWKIHFSELENSVFVGLTDLEKFKQGWAMKGLLYGGPGNLSNGGALITGGYGPKISVGNTVGILAKFEEHKLKVYFDLDGAPLGQAFDLPASVLKSIFPAVHFSGAGKATVTKSTEIPTNLARPEPVYEGIEGDWKCTEFNGQVPLRENVTVGIKKEGENFIINLHVINRINYTLHRVAATGTWEASGGISTRMGGDPESMKFESQMSSIFRSPTKVEVQGDVLVIEGNACSCDAATKWIRYSTAKKPVTENPFQH